MCAARRFGNPASGTAKWAVGDERLSVDVSCWLQHRWHVLQVQRSVFYVGTLRPQTDRRCILAADCPVPDRPAGQPHRPQCCAHKIAGSVANHPVRLRVLRRRPSDSSVQFDGQEQHASQDPSRYWKERHFKYVPAMRTPSSSLSATDRLRKNRSTTMRTVHRSFLRSRR